MRIPISMLVALTCLSGCARAITAETTSGGGGSSQGGGGAGGTGGVTTTTGGGGTGGSTTCTPGESEPCYEGPMDTENVGLCKPGTRTCMPDGSAFGACTGQVLPAAENCLGSSDEDCDGTVNDGCACTPGTTKVCYSGAPGTQNVGTCMPGLQTCLPDGSAYGPCTGEVVPVAESCATFLDDDCDGAVNEADAGCDPADCAGCTLSPAPACGSNVAVVGHYDGGSRTICIAKGDGTPFELALLSYDPTTWTLVGEVSRVTSLQVYSYEPGTTVQGAGAVPTNIQISGSSPADPYDYSMSLGDCPAHTGYAGAVFGAPQAEVCHMETGLPGACSGPDYTCLAITP